MSVLEAQCCRSVQLSICLLGCHVGSTVCCGCGTSMLDWLLSRTLLCDRALRCQRRQAAGVDHSALLPGQPSLSRGPCASQVRLPDRARQHAHLLFRLRYQRKDDRVDECYQPCKHIAKGSWVSEVFIEITTGEFCVQLMKIVFSQTMLCLISEFLVIALMWFYGCGPGGHGDVLDFEKFSLWISDIENLAPHVIASTMVVN